MSCPKCNAPLAEGSAFCNKCGASLTPGLQAPASPSQEPEQELWKGRFSGKALGAWWVLWFLEIGGIVYLWFTIPVDIRQGPWAKWLFLAVVVVPLLVILWNFMIGKMSTRYRLTNYRIFRETGIFSRDIDEIELVRVDDVSVHQNLLQRIFNVGVITVIAPHDQTDPRLELRGIENPIEVKELIRNNVRRRRQGSLNVENI